MRRSRLVRFFAVLAVACAVGGATYAPSRASADSAPADGSSATDSAWQVSTTTYAPTGEGGYVPTYLGNGYFSGRIPAEGTGFSTAPVTTESQLAGFYGQGPGTTIQRANLPAWSTLGYSDGSGTFGNTTAQQCRPNTVCEAESGALAGVARVATDHTGYTGTGFVAGFAASGNVPQRGSTDTLGITDAQGGDTTLAVRYAAGANPSTQTLSVSVNGGAPMTLSMPATGNWNAWAIATLPITVQDGDNTIAVSCGNADTCVANVDSINISASACSYGHYCEAESGDRSGSAKIATDHTGFTGQGFVAGFAASGNTPQRGTSDSVHISGATAGAATISVRYAAGLNSSTQTLTATVNGASPTTVTMPATTNWDTWKVTTVPVTVQGGDNTVTLTCGDADTCVVNVDAVALSAQPISTGDGTVSNYRQTLDLHNGLLTTSLRWTSSAGHSTDLTFTVFVSQAQAHVAAVRVTARPVGWSGRATFVDLLDGRANTLPVSHRTPAPVNLTTISDQRLDGPAHQISEKAATLVLGMTAGIASTLTIDHDQDATTSAADVPAQSVGQQGSIEVTDGQTYTATKYVGVASGTDTPDGSAPLAIASTDPVDAAIAASNSAADSGWGRLLDAHEAAWAKLWKADVSIPHDSALTLKARASLFYLLESTRDGVDWSMSPGGLSSAEYNGHVFWDAETWMYPALLAAHPDLASGLNDYRSTLLDAAKSIATRNGLQGAQFPWESAQSGADVGIHPREIHITGDIALAQWDYYQATGDLAWLRSKGWPLLEAVAQFYTSRAVSDGRGGYDLNGVEGPDENHDNVNNSAYVNVSAITSLQIAQKAAALVGQPADPRWDAVARGLEASIPFDTASNIHPEYDGYNGQTVNQADVVMMQYPWRYPMENAVAQADLDYYTPRTALSGPAMTDAINMIDTAALSTPGCSAYTYFQRSVDPYNVGPFDQYSEHLNATGVIDFTTGIGGFLQELYYGFTGLRWDTDGVDLDPMLPPQLPGLRLTGLQWQGRSFDIDVEPGTTRITLQSGAPMPVTVAGRTRTLSADSHMVVPTRRPDKSPTSDVARCASTSASSADLSFPATAAVDGSDATRWQATSAGATLTVDLDTVQPVRGVTVLSGTATTTAYSIDVSKDGTSWSALGTASAASDPRSSIDVGNAMPGRYLRYRAAAGVIPSIASLSVTTQSGGS
jgi:trehalose/maltose hydrolase-like predicted phosphorylase